MKLSIASFNTENLITAGIPIYGEKHPHFTPEQYRLKTEWIRNQLLKMNADIIGFQEVFEERALRDCLTGTPMSDWHLFVANPTGALPVNAILSRYPIKEAAVVDAMPSPFQFFDDRPTSAALDSEPVAIPMERFSRGVLTATIAFGDQLTLCVMVLHLKSKRPILARGVGRDEADLPELARGSVRSLIRRGIEACGVRQLLSDMLARDETVPICVLGDLNDSDSAVTSSVILGEEPRRGLPQDEKLRRWKQVLQNCRDVQARKSLENFHYTYIHNGHYESLDNIFVSNHFADANVQRIGKVVDVRLFNDHVIDSANSMDRKPMHVTDHGQVLVNIDIGPSQYRQ
ncbi:endonuclease/exonuclease/phosphatase family protein [Massilia sp. TSP1-1-2]|uniref:endonuclease/exonuclease/phosphatase family protein n=1 Tax=unclassified Massilia TaxID=2609279 RepID=UPI003CE9551F